MKWLCLVVAVMLGLVFWLRDDIVAAVFGLVFLFAAFSLWKDDDDTV